MNDQDIKTLKALRVYYGNSVEADALERAIEQLEWQPIDTAPKDGTQILAYRLDAGMFISRFGTMEMFGLPDHEIEQIPESEFFQDDWWADEDRLEAGLCPTHFQHLPEKPSD